VRDTLSLVLAGSDDPGLSSLFVMDVVPAPDASRLAVRVEAPRELDPDAVRSRLEALVPELRAEIADAVERKKTPGITFVVTPAGLTSE
jgi:ribosome-binding factor A